MSWIKEFGICLEQEVRKKCVRVVAKEEVNFVGGRRKLTMAKNRLLVKRGERDLSGARDRIDGSLTFVPRIYRCFPLSA
ncbi:MAG: hypothetical protein HY730_03235 [Candidatus Tectomicrobia bacterium]|uniref:Uncharacterized protein n=1 Tax=Tectimicrobiota bacterium TaxID=2528274 RepID=A0A933GL57_UNCTE|nr:hypothetical protein [Candidatus Tectomicrobia bacterium]